MSESSQGTSRFDEAAATWDDNPHRRQLTETIARTVAQVVPLQKEWRVLEYGCGTAALGFLLTPHVREVVAADASPGMIEQVRRKLAQVPAANLVPVLLDLSRQESPATHFDLVIAAMAMHHVADVPRVLGRMGHMLTKDGYLAIVDLCEEDGSFHRDTQVPHNGFAPESLAETVSRCVPGVRCRWRTIHTVARDDRRYDIFLLTASRTAP